MIVLLALLTQARPAVAQEKECIGEPVSVDIPGPVPLNVSLRVCEPGGDPGGIGAQLGQPETPQRPQKPKKPKQPKSPQGNGGRADGGGGNGIPTGRGGVGRSVPPGASAQIPTGTPGGQLEPAPGDSSTTPRGGPAGDRRDTSGRAGAGSDRRAEQDARGNEGDPAADDAESGSEGPVLVPPGTASAQRGWWVLPLPLLGALLLALAGAWVLAGRRSERLALAGSPGWAGAGEKRRGRYGRAGWEIPRGKPAIKPRVLAEVAAIAAAVVASVFAVQALVVKPVRIPSESMVPTLTMGQELLVERLSLQFGEPDRGDIVVFKPPAGAGDKQCGVPRTVGQACARPTGGQLDSLFVKRVVAEPGERLRILQGRVYIDGKLQLQPWFPDAVACNVCHLPQEITIPPGHFFVMGDNRGDSVDSRFWGPVPEDQIIGRAVFSYWPPGRFGPL